MKIQSSIRKRIIIGFSLFVVLVGVLFSLYNFLFVYAVEDEFFNRLVKDEAQRLTINYEESGELGSPASPFMTVYQDIRQAPEVVRLKISERPESTEAASEDGQYYHYLLTKQPPEFLLVAEVSDYLVVRRIKDNLFIILGITLGIILLIALIIGYWMAAKTINPLSRLAALISQSQPQALARGFASEFPDNEIGLLAHTLDDTLARVENFVAREQAFTRDASHELRSPIAGIKGAIELLQKQETSPRTQELSQRIADSVLQMERVVSALLVLAREESDSVRKQAVKVLPIAEQVVINQAGLLEGKDVAVKVDITASQTLNSTAGVVEILLSNLIGNAFQYTQQGEVVIALNGQKLMVSDSGTGIAPDVAGRETEAMVKASDSPGFGIGLSIVKRLCEQQHLTLNIETSAKGTRVLVDFEDTKAID